MVDVTKAAQLKHAKRQALAWLIGAAIVFVGLTVLQTIAPDNAALWWVQLVKMISEAALVGGLADWFAVSALFRPIPALHPIPHTNIVANNQSVIAQNLAVFVKDKFFHNDAIETLVSGSHPARAMGEWLQQPSNAARLAKYITDSLAGLLHVIDDAPVREALHKGVHKALGHIELGAIVAGGVKVMTRDGRHQRLLNKLLDKLSESLQQETTQQFIAEKLTEWLKTEHRRLEKILPSSWLSEQGAGIAISALAHVLADVNRDPQHPIRVELNTQLTRFIDDLEHNADAHQKLNDFRDRLLNSETVGQYLNSIFAEMRQWLDSDIAAENGQIRTRLTKWLQASGTKLAQDKALQEAVDHHIGEAARYAAPEMADFLAGHIRKTIESWDAAQLSQQIELNIGKDLQKVRINGTLVGGLIGGLLFGIEQLIHFSL